MLQRLKLYWKNLPSLFRASVFGYLFSTVVGLVLCPLLHLPFAGWMIGNTALFLYDIYKYLFKKKNLS